MRLDTSVNSRSLIDRLQPLTKLGILAIESLHGLEQLKPRPMPSPTVIQNSSHMDSTSPEYLAPSTLNITHTCLISTEPYANSSLHNETSSSRIPHASMTSTLCASTHVKPESLKRKLDSGPAVLQQNTGKRTHATNGMPASVHAKHPLADIGMSAPDVDSLATLSLTATK